MIKKLIISLLGLASLSITYAEPIRLHPFNPHYFLYNGKPAILLTSAEIYGAVLNLDFNYNKYLDALADGGMNYTRIYTGAYFEMADKWFKDQSLGPADNRLCLPWGRSNVPGYIKGGNKFDLDKWNPEYFNRLSDFISYAGEKGVIVEICLFNAQKPWQWDFQPMNGNCNVNNVGFCKHNEFQTLKDLKLVNYQKAYVQKITEAVNEFDNVILEIIDEPTIISGGGPGTNAADAVPWIKEMLKTIVETENALPQKHLIAQQVEGGATQGIVDLSADTAISVIVGQYTWQNVNQVGALKLLDKKYRLGKMIEFNETVIYPTGYKNGNTLDDSRVESWEFIIGGGGSYNQLNSLYTTHNENAEETENFRVLRQLKILKSFICSLDFVKMKKNDAFTINNTSSKPFARSICEQGKQYAFYMHHSKNPNGNPSLFTYYQADPGKYTENITIDIPKGTYRADWINPATGKIVRSIYFTSKKDNYKLTSPEYSVDMALKIIRIL